MIGLSLPVTARRRRWPGLPLLDTVRGRIIVGFGSFVLILVLVTAVGIWLQREHQSHVRSAEVGAETVSRLQAAKLNGAMAVAVLQQYVMSGDESLAVTVQPRLVFATDSLEEAAAQEAAQGHHDTAAAIAGVIDAAGFLPDLVEQAVELQRSGDVEGAVAALEAAVPKMLQLEVQFDALTRQEQAEATALQHRAERAHSLAFQLLIASGLTGALFAAAAAALTAVSILKPLRHLEATALAVSGGDLQARAHVSGPRELAHLGSVLNGMTDSLVEARRSLERKVEERTAELRLSNEALRESEEKFRAFLEYAPIAAVITNSEGLIQVVNGAAEAMFGYIREELLGQAIETLVPERFREGHAGHCADYLSEPQRRPMASDRDIVGRRKDGTEFPAACGLGFVETGDGRLAISFIADMTERKRAIEALRRAEAHYRGLFENVPVGIYRTTPDGQILDANPSIIEMMGYADRESYLALAASDLYVDRQDRERWQALMEREGVVRAFESRARRRDGSVIWVRDSARAVRDAGGQLLCYEGTWEDITERKRAEVTLRESEEKYRLLVETMNEGLGVQDENGVITYVNQRLCQMLGSTRDQLTGHPIATIIHEDGLPEFKANMAARLAGKRTSYELELKTKDGGKVTTLASGQPLFGPEGEPRGSFAVLTDISERKRAEVTLRRSEAHFRSLIENSFDIVLCVGPDGTIHYASPSVERATGYKPEEIIGKNPAELLHPDDLPGVMAAVAESLRSLGSGPVLQTRLRHRDGSWRTVEGIGSAFRDEPGTPPNIVVNLRDITEREQTEEALRQSEAKYRTLVEQSPAGIFIAGLDDASSATYCSPQLERMFGISRADWISDRQWWVKQLHPDDRERVVAEFARAMSTGETFVSESRMVTRDGRIVSVNVRAAVVRDGKGRPYCVQGIVLDITERVQAEEALRRLNEALEGERNAVRELNRSLEEKVGERTEALRLANEELRQRNRQLLDARAQAGTDALTGLANHRAFHQRIRDEVSRANVDRKGLGLVMLDIDGFKAVNDSLGHQAGDDVLRRLAATLDAEVGQEHAYRYGGDEFAVLVPGTSHRQAIRIAERLRSAVERRVGGGASSITVSLGVATFPDTAASADELIYGADAAMYWAKSAGKNRVGDWSRLVRQRAEGALPWYAADSAVKAPDVVAALVAALAAKDPATKDHTERCSWYAARLAEELGLDERDTSIVRLASLLHDIGKLAVPDEVLFKPGPLNEDEWAQMKRHPTTALHVLGQVRTVASAVPAILHHHEHFDGSGYPDGLAGEDIPVASRILLVSDAFDAMTTDRPYRRAMPVEAAVAELKANSGTQFDPRVVEAFLRVLSRHGPQPLHWTDGDERSDGHRRTAAAQQAPRLSRRRPPLCNDSACTCVSLGEAPSGGQPDRAVGSSCWRTGSGRS